MIATETSEILKWYIIIVVSILESTNDPFNVGWSHHCGRERENLFFSWMAMI